MKPGHSIPKQGTGHFDMAYTSMCDAPLDQRLLENKRCAGGQAELQA